MWLKNSTLEQAGQQEHPGELQPGRVIVGHIASGIEIIFTKCVLGMWLFLHLRKRESHENQEAPGGWKGCFVQNEQWCSAGRGLLVGNMGNLSRSCRRAVLSAVRGSGQRAARSALGT